MCDAINSRITLVLLCCTVADMTQRLTRGLSLRQSTRLVMQLGCVFLVTSSMLLAAMTAPRTAMMLKLMTHRPMSGPRLVTVCFNENY